MSKLHEVFNGKTVTIMGLTPAVPALVKLLTARGAKVRVSELNTKDQVAEPAKELALIKPEIEVEFGKNSPQLFLDADMVVVASGIRLDSKPLDEVKAKGIPVYNEIELLANDISVPIVAIAGTEGKTSVAFMAKAMLDAAKKSVFFVGDHGDHLANYFLKGSKAEVLIIELSPAQMEAVQRFRPHVFVLGGLQPPFPDRFNTLEAYSAALRNVLRNLDEKCSLVYNFRDANLKSLIMGSPTPKWVYRRKDPISLGEETAKVYKGSWLGSGGRELHWKDNSGNRATFNLRGLNLFGVHNLDNLMAAVNVAKLLGVANEHIQQAIQTFPGVPHRLEFVKKKGGVRLINDSRSTRVDTLRLALESFPLDPIILIAGGRDAQADFAALADIVKSRVKTLVLVGEAKEHLNRCLGDYSETFLVGTFEEGILLSYQKSREGDIILLSPGCESYDMFVSYEERGNYFKKYVEEL